MPSRRPRILFAWELGDNYGHASKIVEVAKALGERAHISIAARVPAAVRAMANGLDATIGPAPHVPFQPPSDPNEIAFGYSDNLAYLGWGSAGGLSRLVEDWHAVFNREAPDILVAQAAPTALLAARGANFTVTTLGSGFDSPPRSNPMPPFIHWTKDEGGRRRKTLEVREAAILARANQVLAVNKCAPLSAVCDVLRADHSYLATIPELDQYGPRSRFEPDHPPYVGQLITTSQGVRKNWPKATGRKRIIAYLRPNTQAALSALHGLALLRSQHDILLAAPGISHSFARELTNAGVDVTDGPLHLDGLLEQADIGVSHASNGIAAAFLIAGLPQLGLPNHAEQAMVAYAISKGKLGLGLGGAYTSEHFVDHINRLVSDTEIAQTTKACALKIAQNSDYATPAQRIANDMLERFAHTV